MLGGSMPGITASQKVSLAMSGASGNSLPSLVSAGLTKGAVSGAGAGAFGGGDKGGESD